MSVGCLDQVEELPASQQVVGFDLGLKQFLIPSSGEPVENPRYFRKTEKRLAKAQRRLSRMKKGSKNYIKQRIKVAKLHERISNQRKDFPSQAVDQADKRKPNYLPGRFASEEHGQEP